MCSEQGEGHIQLHLSHKNTSTPEGICTESAKQQSKPKCLLRTHSVLHVAQDRVGGSNDEEAQHCLPRNKKLLQTYIVSNQ